MTIARLGKLNPAHPQPPFNDLLYSKSGAKRPGVFIRQIRDLWDNALSLPRVIRQIVCLPPPPFSYRLTTPFCTSNQKVRDTILRMDSLVPPSILHHHLRR